MAGAGHVQTKGFGRLGNVRLQSASKPGSREEVLVDLVDASIGKLSGDADARIGSPRS